MTQCPVDEGTTMRFSKEYAKLARTTFTTIRANTGYYKIGQRVVVETPLREFVADVVDVKLARKEDITEEFAYIDADCSRMELIMQLEKWYGTTYNDFVIIKLRKLL